MGYYIYNGQRLTYQGKQAVGPNVYDDWFLPSMDELIQMKANIEGIPAANFVFGTYWSSTESSNDEGWALSSGSGSGLPKDSNRKVRAARSFTAASGAYSIGDPGPAGGWIFFIQTSTTYYEISPEDLSSGTPWSNIDDTLIGTTQDEIGTGAANTLAIINQSGHVSSAAKLCADLVIYN